MLASAGANSALLGAPMWEAAALLASPVPLQGQSQHQLAPGLQLGPYVIEGRLGAGGMGEVYRAKDKRLHRSVALKVLPPHLARSPGLQQRLEREGAAISSLNHPNICTLYDIGRQDDIDYLVMELLEGEPLAQRLKRGALPLPEVLEFAIQIAGALDTAHSKGIIHRDIKPANIFVAGRRQVKVLDFGLAKLKEPPTGSQFETVASEESLTGSGLVVGTVGYMSPEQAEGKPMDARSDIFSFGSVLYEMLTGSRAFQGESKVATLSAILHSEPKPVSEMVAGAPPELEKLIGRCLRKDRERRIQHMVDVKLALEEMNEESESGRLDTASPRPQNRHLTLFWMSVAAVLLIAAGIGVWFRESKNGMSEVPLAAIPLTGYPGFQAKATFSPDGNQVAFCWNGEKQSNLDIYAKVVGAGPPLRLTTNPAADCQPAWSPDGRSIAFLRELPAGPPDRIQRAAVLLIPALGGPERRLAETSDFSSAPAWSPDGKWLVIVDRLSPTEPDALFALSVESGEKRKLTTPPPSGRDYNPAFSPDGRALAFVRATSRGSAAFYGSANVQVLYLSNGVTPKAGPRQLTDAQSSSRIAWTTDGREIVFCSGSIFQPSLWRIASDGSGKPQLLASIGEGAYDPVISRQGRRIAYSRYTLISHIWRLEVPGAHGNTGAQNPKAAPFLTSTRREQDPAYSPDGKRIAFSSGRSSRHANSEIWICDADGSNPVQLTSLDAYAGTPRWSPDGAHLVFDAQRDGKWAVYLISANGGQPKRMTSGPANDDVPSWSRDGKWIYFASDRTGEDHLWKMPAAGGEAVQVTRNGGATGLESPDGKTLYYARGREDTSLWKVPVMGGEEAQVLDSLNWAGNFAVVDSGIYFVATQQPVARSIQFFSFATGKVRSVATMEKEAASGLTVSPDGRWILYDQADQFETELMLVENFH